MLYECLCNGPAKGECLGRIIEMRELDVLIVTEMELKGRAGKVEIWDGERKFSGARAEKIEMCMKFKEC